MELKPYQVGENDIVLAENEQKAIEFLKEYSGCFDKDEQLDVEDLSPRLDMKLMSEDGEFFSTLGDYIADMKEPQYVVGWE